MCLICRNEKSISPSPLCHSCSDLCVFLGGEGASLAAQRVNNLPATQETWVQSLNLEDSPGGGNGYPLQYSCLENPMDRGDWWAAVHRVAKSRTQLKRLSTHARMHIIVAEQEDKNRLDPR